MKITIETSTKAKVEEFFEFLKKRSSADEHKGNVDIIADFIDKVMVIELKRLQNDPDIFEENFEVPDDVILEPLKKVKKQFDDVFNGFLKDKGSITTNSNNQIHILK